HDALPIYYLSERFGGEPGEVQILRRRRRLYLQPLGMRAVQDGFHNDSFAYVKADTVTRLHAIFFELLCFQTPDSSSLGLSCFPRSSDDHIFIVVSQAPVLGE